MAKIDGRGLVDDGSENLTVAGALTVSGAPSGVSPGKMNTVATMSNGANTTLTKPGYYKYSGGTTGAVSSCTGTMPSPADHPGAMFVFAPADGTGGGMFLTGTAVTQNVVFSAQSGTFGSAGSVASQGTKLTLPNSGSVVLISTGLTWHHLASSGSLTFA